MLSLVGLLFGFKRTLGESLVLLRGIVRVWVRDRVGVTDKLGGGVGILLRDMVRVRVGGEAMLSPGLGAVAGERLMR